MGLHKGMGPRNQKLGFKAPLNPLWTRGLGFRVYHEICHDLYTPSTSIDLIVYMMIYVIDSTFSTTCGKEEVET